MLGEVLYGAGGGDRGWEVRGFGGSWVGRAEEPEEDVDVVAGFCEE